MQVRQPANIVFSTGSVVLVVLVKDVICAGLVTVEEGKRGYIGELYDGDGYAVEVVKFCEALMIVTVVVFYKIRCCSRDLQAP